MPNSKLYNEVITNITHEGVRRLDIALGGRCGMWQKDKESLIRCWIFTTWGKYQGLGVGLRRIAKSGN